MPTDGFTLRGRIKNLLRSPSTKVKVRRKESLDTKVTLEKVLGVTAAGNSALTCDPCSGLVAYPAGCVVVLLNPQRNQQQHIINTARKTITALSFSSDGKYLVTGESGHLPAVRLWDVAERCQVSQLQTHKHGVSCVAFSPNGKYIVSVGNQHDMMVSVWAWKKDFVVAANKVSSKVTGVSFSEDSSYFVTVGNRHVKFWYLDHCKNNKSSTPVPLFGRSGLLGELRNNCFTAVACGRGSKCDSAFCISSSGLLCEFNHRRMLDKWVDLRTSAAHSLCVSEKLVFCGSSDGTVRVFSSSDLSFICTLPRPHTLKPHLQTLRPCPVTSDINIWTHSSSADDRYPDAVALTFDPGSSWLSCVYSDHSVYVWDLRDVNRVEKVHCALYHSSCVWDLQMFPDVPSSSGLWSGVFFSCSADNSIRIWLLNDSGQTSIQSERLLTTDLLNILHIEEKADSSSESDSSSVSDKTTDSQSTENRTGIRTICISPDGNHLASGDRSGNLRIHDLSSLEQILQVEAHDAEILCLEYSKPNTGFSFLATASRDRLIHVLDAKRGFSLLQTLEDHSSSITALKFTTNEDKVRMISCGVDKSIYFRTAQKTEGGAEFHRSHHSVKKTTLYDMSVDPTCKYAAVGCQDRCIRLFDISTGKQKKVYKGSVSEDGSLLKVEIDPSGLFVATSCSDKNISIFDFYTGECVATMYGHSEIVTGLKFTNDCRHLVSVSADSCVFVWRLAPELTKKMLERLCQIIENPGESLDPADNSRELCSVPSIGSLSSESEHEREDTTTGEDQTVSSTESSQAEDEDTGGSDEGQDWELAKPRTAVAPEMVKRPRRRWSHRIGSLELMVKSMLDLRQLDSFGQKKSSNSPIQCRDRRSMSSLQDPAVIEQKLDEQSRRRSAWLNSDWLSRSRSLSGASETFPEDSERDSRMKGASSRGQWRSSDSQDSRSPDSACSLGYDSRESTPDLLLDDVDSLNGSDPDQEEERMEQACPVTVNSVEEALKAVTDAYIGAFSPSSHQTLTHNNNRGGGARAGVGDGVSPSTAESRVPKPSFSSRFLSRGHDSPHRVQTSAQESSPSPNPPVSEVRPLMEDVQDKSTDDTNAFKSDQNTDTDGAQKSRRTSGVLWRRSIPSANSPSVQKTTEHLHKAQSLHNLASETSFSLMSSECKPIHKRPQHVDQTKPSPLYSSPSSPPLSRLSSPLPCDSSSSPRVLHSYMNPTTSSIAKVSRSISVGEGLQLGSPPHSPLFAKTKASGDAGVVWSVSSPVACPLPKSQSPPAPRRASFSPNNVNNSRIPHLRQTLGPRRSLGLESTHSHSRSCSSLNFASDVAPGNHKPVVRQPSTEQSGLSVRMGKQKSAKQAEQLRKVCPLVDAECSKKNAVPQEESITMETCRQVISELQDSLRRTIHAYNRITDRDSTEEQQQQMKSLLSDALLSVKAELQTLPHPDLQRDSTQSDRAPDDKTLLLLEQYAQLLFQSVEKKLDNKS